MTMVEVPRGSVLTEQDAPGLECFVIVEGSASAWRNGRRLTGFDPGSFFGELALLDRKVRAATVIAETPMRLLALSSTEFKSLTATVPQVAYRIMAEMGARLRTTNDMVGAEAEAAYGHPSEEGGRTSEEGGRETTPPLGDELAVAAAEA